MMKKNQFVKTMLGTVLASAVCVSLFGCAPDTNGEPTVDEAGNTIIQIMVHVAQQSAEGMAYSRITDSFNASDTAKENKIRVRVDYSPRSTSATGYETELIAMMNQGNLPDIITFDAPNTWSYASAGILSDIRRRHRTISLRSAKIHTRGNCTVFPFRSRARGSIITRQFSAKRDFWIVSRA